MTTRQHTTETLNNNYGADEIEVLEGLEPIRKRPGMYIGDTSTALQHNYRLI